MSTFEESFLAHWGEGQRAPYDPVKAHEYYMRTRKLKGRKKKASIPESVKKEYGEHLKKFLGTLPMAKKGGADLKETARFVRKMSKMTDKQMVAAAKELTKLKAGQKVVSQEAMHKVETINALLQNRSRVRAKNGTGPKKRISTKIYEDGSVSRRPMVVKSKRTIGKPPPKPSPDPAAWKPRTQPRRSVNDMRSAFERMTTTQKLEDLARRKNAQRDQTG